MFKIHRHREAEAFLQRAEAWLMQAEAENNLVLGLARELTKTTKGYELPLYLATVERAGAVVGCAFRTPPFKMGLTQMPEAALPALVDDVAQVYDELPAVLGAETETKGFAALWSAKRGIANHAGRRQRIYQLDALTPPSRMPPGHLRCAEPDDIDLVATWLVGFGHDTGLLALDADVLAEKRITQQAFYLWDDEGPTSLAGATGYTPHGARIGYVYTPPEHRGRGYASACTAALSQHLLDAGLTFCFLYTDLANPTSNGIYQRLGYYPVCDVMDYDFERRDNL